MELPTYSYVKDDRCYVCGATGPVYRWDDYDESSECICRACAQTSVERLAAASEEAPRFRHRKGGVYAVNGRRVLHADVRPGELAFRSQDDLMPYEVTDPIKAGEEAVFYQRASDGSRWCRPASMFDDGRFLPL